MAARALTAALIVTLALQADGKARAYLQSRDPRGRPVGWETANLNLTLSSTTPVGVSPAAMRDAAERAAATWNGIECAAVRIAIRAAPSDIAVVKEDGKNMLVVHKIAWCTDEIGRSCHQEAHPALTNVRYKSSARRGRSEIHEVDIEINAVHFRWDDPAAPNGADLETVLTHELGHALGLADACAAAAGLLRAGAKKQAQDCVTASPERRASVMWPLGAPNDVRRRVLSAQDRRAICDMYPRRRAHD